MLSVRAEDMALEETHTARFLLLEELAELKRQVHLCEVRAIDQPYLFIFV
jgi:hypothetical protein